MSLPFEPDVRRALDAAPFVNIGGHQPGAQAAEALSTLYDPATAQTKHYAPVVMGEGNIASLTEAAPNTIFVSDARQLSMVFDTFHDVVGYHSPASIAFRDYSLVHEPEHDVALRALGCKRTYYGLELTKVETENGLEYGRQPLVRAVDFVTTALGLAAVRMYPEFPSPDDQADRRAMGYGKYQLFSRILQHNAAFPAYPLPLPRQLAAAPEHVLQFIDRAYGQEEPYTDTHREAFERFLDAYQPESV